MALQLEFNLSTDPVFLKDSGEVWDCQCVGQGVRKSLISPFEGQARHDWPLSYGLNWKRRSPQRQSCKITLFSPYPVVRTTKARDRSVAARIAFAQPLFPFQSIAVSGFSFSGHAKPVLLRGKRWEVLARGNRFSSAVFCLQILDQLADQSGRFLELDQSGAGVERR
jgi:hypothetical protein